MDSFEFNKIAGAALSALLLIFGGRTLMDVVAKEHKPEKPGWALKFRTLMRARKAKKD